MIRIHRSRPHRGLVLALGCLVLFAGGCLGRSPEVHLFSMGTGSRLEKSDRLPDAAVLIGPVRLPRDLDRPQFARRARGGEIELDEFNRWVGGFGTNFIRAVADNVRRQLGSPRVVGFPSQAPFGFDDRVRIHVDEFIVDETGQLRVSVRWALSSGAGDEEPDLDVFEGDYEVEGSSAAALVAAHDRALAELARRIADQIVERATQPPVAP